MLESKIVPHIVMKSQPNFCSFLALTGCALLFVSQAQAASYYWDTNGATSGLGNTAGTWGTSTFEGTVPSAVVLDGTLTTAGTATTNADAIYFGTNNLALGSTASTIGITAAGVTINTIVFGAGQGSQGVTLSGGGGTVTLAGTGPSATPTIGVYNTGTNIIGAVLTGTAGMVLTGPGTLQVTGAATYTGTTTIQGGSTLRVGDGISGNLFNTTPSALTFSGGGGTININEAAGSTQSMGALTFSAGDGTIQSTYGGSGNSAVTFASLAARTAGATGNFVISSGSNGTTNKIVLTGASTGILLDKGFFFGGSNYAAYDTGGYVRAFGAGDAGFVSIGAGADLGSRATTDNVSLTGSLSAQGASAVNTINMGANSIAMDSAGTSLVLQTNGILSSGSASATIGGGTTPRLQSTTASGEMVIRVDGSSDALSISSIIQNNTGASALTKTGAGTLTLSGANTYTGITTINAGTLIASGGSAIADNGAVALSNAAGAVFQLNNSETIGQLSGGGFSGGNVNVGANALTIANANSQTFSGQFIGTSSGVVNLTTGTLTLGNKNTFAGTINLNGGTLVLAYGNDGTANPAPLSSGGTINMAGGTFLNLVPAPNAAGGVASTIMTTGIVGGVNSNGMAISNAIVVTSGTATIQTTGQTGANDWKWNFSGGVTGGASGTQTLAIVEGGAVTQSHGDRQDILFSGVIANGSGGTLGVSVDFKSSSATSGQMVDVNLSGANTFTGPLVVTNTRGLVFSYAGPTTGGSGAYLGIGGEVQNSNGNGGRRVLVGTGGLGFVSAGNFSYSNTISLATGTVFDYVSSANQILGGVISGGGNLMLEASVGAVGSLTLNAQNTFTGSTVINSGILKLGDALSIQNSAIDTTNSTVGTSAIGLRITSTTLTLGGLIGTKNFSTIFETNSDGGSGGTTGLGGYSGITALTLNPQAGSSVTYSGNLVDATVGMTLIKTGAGTQILSGANTYTGGTTLTTGTLQFGKLTAQSATGVVAVGTGTTLAVNIGGVGDWTTGSTGNGTLAGLVAGLGGQSGGTITYAGTATLGFDTTSATSPQTSTTSGIANAVTTLGINKLGSNTLVLQGNNSYNGLTTVTSGTLILTGTNTNAGGATIASGTTLQFGKLVSQSASGAVAVNAGGTLTVNLGGTGEWTTGTSGNGTIGGLLAGLGGQSGGTVTYSGAVTLGLDTSNGASSQTYSAAIGNVGTTLGINKMGINTLVLSAANTYTGVTTVNGGTLLLDMSGTGALASTSALALGGGNFQVKGKTSGTTSQTLGALTLSANSNNTITLDSNSGTGTTLVLASSAPTRAIGSSLLIDLSIANTTLNSTLGLTAAAQTTTQGILGYALVKDASGIGFAANVGGSIVRYTGADTTFAAASNSATTNFKTTPVGTSTTGSPYIAGSVASPSWNSLHIDTASATGANFLSLNGTVTLTQKAVLMTGNNDFTIQSGTLGANNSEVIIHQTGTGLLTINSAISGGTGSLTKDGTGTLLVGTNANAFSGGTTVNAGTLQLAAVGAGPGYIRGTLTINSGATVAPLFSGTGWGLGFQSGTSVSTININGGTLNFVGTANNGGTAASTINMTGGTIGGGGTFDWYFGNTTNPFLNSLLSGTTSTVSANINLRLNARTNNLTFNVADSAVTNDLLVSGNIISVNTGDNQGGIIKNGAGRLNLSGTSTYNGDTTVNAGTLEISGTGRIYNSGNPQASGTVVTVAAGAQIILSGSANNVLGFGTNESWVVSGTINSTGGSAQTLSPTITFNNGTLTGVANGTFGTYLTNSGYTVTMTANGSSNVISAANFGMPGNLALATPLVTDALSVSTPLGLAGNTGGLTKSGLGTVTLTGVNLYTGATTVNGGTLRVNSAGSINTTSSIAVNAGGTLRYNSSTALTVAPTLNGAGIGSRAVLGGTGTINAAVTLDNLGDVLSPGNSPGVQNYAVGQTWSSFSYDWELNDWTAAVAGTNIDQITITGTLDLSAVTANQYILNILSLMNNNSSGLVGSGGGNLFSETNNSWTILTATTITGFNASEWSINATGFTDNETGTWSISQSGNSLLLNYAAIPEPSVALLGGLSLLGVMLRRRRKD